MSETDAINREIAAIKLLPRAYQEEIFAQARDTNIIAALDTGSGKTFIGALLIKWIVAQESSNGKKIFFLVPKVPLVDQQSDFLRAQTPLRVKGYYGSMGVDGWDSSSWQSELEEADVLVMTAQIFYDLIQHAYWKMEKVSLIVFDECHHAQKNHTYNRIMNEHYSRCPIPSRPKIFGMTASPIWNVQKPHESLQGMQRNLDARILAVREHIDELFEHSPKPTEMVRHYPCSPLSYSLYQSPSLWECLESARLIGTFDVKKSDLSKLKARYDLAMYDVGPFAADYFLHTYMNTKMTERLRKDYEAYLQNIPMNAMEIDKSDERPNIKKGENALDRLRSHLDAFAPCLSLDFEIPSSWLSPKLLALVDILQGYSSKNFQGILFVEQRQVATALSWLLPRLPQLKAWVRCAELMGHAGTGKTDGTPGMAANVQKSVVKSFRDGSHNLLVATSVAEEGLDFPACELVIRFDSVQHLVGYLQSRGRARHHNSTFVVMIRENNTIELARYNKFKENEPELRKIYQGLHQLPVADTDDADDQDHPSDMAERETFEVPSTGAMLTYSSAISLLGHLCSLIPHDRYTPAHRPKYSGAFQSTLKLPSALPLDKDDLVYYGPPKRSKKEAKRAVAYIAAKALYTLGVFDDHLTPAKASKGKNIEDPDGCPIPEVKECPLMMDVLVKDPWRMGPVWWLHVISLHGRRCAGLVTGTRLPQVDLMADGTPVEIGPPTGIEMNSDEESLVEVMQEFTKMGLWWCVTGSPVDSSLGCYLVPLDASCDQPDWESMERALAHKLGTYDWDGITDRYCDRLLLMNSKKCGQPLLLRRLRSDLSPLSKLPVDLAADSGFNTFSDYFVHKYCGTDTVIQPISEGPLLEVSPAPRRCSSIYYPKTLEPTDSLEINSDDFKFFLPQSLCKWAYLSEDVYNAFYVLPKLCHRIVDIWRVRCAQLELQLPAISEDQLAEAFTLPCANGGFNNQRLETLGDSVLKLSVIVYLYNRFPHKHEGQLDLLKRNCISNRVLLARAREKGLQCFLSSEVQRTRAFGYTIDQLQSLPKNDSASPVVTRRFARRSLQDCMEASLGASYLTGGIEMALQTGTALGLCLGGAIPWPIRYGLPEESTTATLFNLLQVSLGYTFRNGRLLMEAVTHPSFDSPGGSCYQRLEFLGDAIIELVLSEFLFAKFANATSGQLTWSRARAVCGPTLAAVAVKRLSLQKYMLANNVELSKAIQQQVDLLTSAPYDVLVMNPWKYDPPKALSDMLESVVGAIFVDSGYDFVGASAIVRELMKEVLDILTPNMPKDPISELMIWTSKAGCRRIRFSKSTSNTILKRNDSVTVLIHDKAVVGPISAANLSLAKTVASAKALSILSDVNSSQALHCLCDCGKDPREIEPSSDAKREKDLNDETEEDFAVIGAIRLQEIEGDLNGNDEQLDDRSDIDEQEVEAMVQYAMEVDMEHQSSIFA